MFSDVPTPEGDLKTRALLEGMAKLGYRAVGVGERDLFSGYDEFVRRTKGLPLKFVSTNIVRQDTRDPVFDPYVVIEAKGASGKPVRVGVLAVVRYNPMFVKAGPGGANLAIAAPADALRKYVDDLRKKSDVVVLLAALGKDDAHRLAQDVPGIDIILGSYGGIYSTQEEAEGATRIFYAGDQGRRIGECRLYLGPDGRVASQIPYLYFLTARYPEEPQMLEFVNGVLSKVKDLKTPAKTASPPAVGEGGRASR